MNQSSSYKWKLGMFTIVGLSLLFITIYFIGKNKNMFGSTFGLTTQFRNVSGLKVGNNVRFSGINIGTVDRIEFLSDSSVSVHLIIKEEVQKFLKTNAIASIGSDGLMGDKVLTISHGNSSNEIIKNNATIASAKAIEMEDIMKSVKMSVDNAVVITDELAKFTVNINNKEGVLSKLMTDKEMAGSIKKSILNLETTSNEFSSFTTKMNNGNGALSKLVADKKMGKMVDSTMKNVQDITEAAKHNFLLRGYFKKQKKAAAKKKVKK